MAAKTAAVRGEGGNRLGGQHLDRIAAIAPTQQVDPLGAQLR